MCIACTAKPCIFGGICGDILKNVPWILWQVPEIKFFEELGLVFGHNVGVSYVSTDIPSCWVLWRMMTLLLPCTVTSASFSWHNHFLMNIDKIPQNMTIYNIEEALRPADFYLVVQAIKRVSVYDQKEHSYKTPSLHLSWVSYCKHMWHHTLQSSNCRRQCA